MGMDVFGKEPSSEAGKYFRCNVWWWRPLWDYACSVGRTVISPEMHQQGHHNDGAGLDDAKSKELAALLQAELESGRTADFAIKRQRALAALPLHDCPHCGGSGVRTDEVGVRMGMPERMNPHTDKPGWCNGCDGKGTQPDEETQYSFSAETVQKFAVFLDACGGFEIW